MATLVQPVSTRLRQLLAERCTSGTLREADLVAGTLLQPSFDLPSHLRAHHLGTLLEWLVASMHKTTRGEETTKHKKLSTRVPLHLEPLAWQLLLKLIKHYPMTPTALAVTMAAAASAVKVSHQLQDPIPRVQDLLLAVVAVLQQLPKLPVAPSFDPCLAVLAATLESYPWPPKDADCDWEGRCAITQAAVHLVTTSLHGHSNSKKVFQAIMTSQVALPLLRLAFPQAASIAALQEVFGLSVQGQVTQLQLPDQLMHDCRILLHAVLFNEQHILGLFELCGRFAESRLLNKEAELAALISSSNKHHSSYHTQLLQVLQAGLSTPETRDAVCCALPWLMHCFMSAVARYRSAAAADVLGKATSAATPKGDPTLNQRAGSNTSTPGAEFNMFVVLSCMILDHLHPSTTPCKEAEEHTAKRQKSAHAHTQNTASDNSCSPASDLAAGLALLLSAVKGSRVYQPTQDLTGTHRAFLQWISEELLRVQQQHSADPLQGASCAVAVAAGQSALLDVEHRALQPQLSELWHLLWQTAGHSDAGLRVAVAASQRLLQAYSELRQLQFLLASLSASLKQSSLAAAAGPVLLDAQFSYSVAQAVRQLPQGQVPSFLAFLAQNTAEWLQESSPSAACLLQAVAQLHATCLTALRVDAATALAVARAVQELLSPKLAAPFLQSACSVCRSKASAVEFGRLELGLRVYAGAVQLHATAAALHPEVDALLDQAISACQYGISKPEVAGVSCGYFAALLAQLPEQDVSPALKSCRKSSGMDDLLPALASNLLQPNALKTHPGACYAMYRCMMQRVQMLGEQLCRLSHTAISTQQEGDDSSASPTDPTAKLTEMQTLVRLLLQPFTFADGTSALPIVPSEASQSAVLPQALPFATALELLLHHPVQLPGYACTSASQLLCCLWSECLAAASTWSCHAQSEQAVCVLQWMLALVAAARSQLQGMHAGSTFYELHPNKAAPYFPPSVVPPSSGDTCALQSLGGSSHAVLHLPEFQLLPPMRTALPTALSQLLQNLLKALTAAAPFASSSASGHDAQPAIAVTSCVLSLLGSHKAVKHKELGKVLKAATKQIQRQCATSTASQSTSTDFNVTVLPPVALSMLQQLLVEAGWLHHSCWDARTTADVCSRLQLTAVLLCNLLQEGHNQALAQGLHQCAVQCIRLWARLLRTSPPSSTHETSGKIRERTVKWLVSASLLLVVHGLQGTSDATLEACAGVMMASLSGHESPVEVGVLLLQHAADAADISTLATARQVCVHVHLASAAVAAVAEKPCSISLEQAESLLHQCDKQLSRLITAAAAHSASASSRHYLSASCCSLLATLSHSLRILSSNKAQSRRLQPAALLHVTSVLQALLLFGNTPARQPLPHCSLLQALSCLHAVSRCSGQAGSTPDVAAGLSKALLHLHLHLHAQLTAPQLAPWPTAGGVWGLMMADLPPHSTSASTRQALLASFQDLLLSTDLEERKRIWQQLLDIVHPAVMASPAPLLLPALQYALLGLEAPHLQSVVARTGPDLLLQCAQLLSACACRASGRLAEDLPPVLCTTLRCAESIVSREKAFSLSALHLSTCLQGVHAMLQIHQPACGRHVTGSAQTAITSGAALEVAQLAGVFTGSCTLLVAAVRHRTAEVSGCGPLLLQCLRSLLQALCHWGRVWAEQRSTLDAAGTQSATSVVAGLVRFARDLAHVYEVLGQRKEILGRFAIHLLADYLTIAVVPITAGAQTTDRDLDVGLPSQGAALPPEAQSALRQGAYVLLSCLGAPELQHLHAVLGSGAGGARRAALASLKKDFDKGYKYTGKV